MAGRPKNPEDPRQLLEKTLKLIARDLFHIDQMGNAGKLEPDVARCLVQYNDTLLKHIRTEDEETRKEKLKLSRMSGKELRNLAKQFVNQEDDKS